MANCKKPGYEAVNKKDLMKLGAIKKLSIIDLLLFYIKFYV